MFLGGMNTDIAMMVRMFNPRTLSDTYCLANLQEATNESRIKSKPVYARYRNVSSTSYGSYGGGRKHLSKRNMRKKEPRINVSTVIKKGEEEEFSGEEGLEECLVEEFSPVAQEQNP
ncbi:hypothetical protein Tco_0135648 [Tanacetum coccineum]